MSQAKSGDTVRIHYTGKLDDGTQFDTSADSDPLEFALGGGQVIPGIENAVTGMTVGDSKSIRLEVDEAYGPRHEQLVQEVERSRFPDDLEPEVGMALQGQGPDGQLTPLTITAVSAASVTIDANHPLAGHVLIFDIKLIAIV